MTNAANMKFQIYKAELPQKAEDLIMQGISDTVLELSDILATPMFNTRNFHTLQQDFNKKMLENKLIDIDFSVENNMNNETDTESSPKILNDSKVACNALISEMVKIVKPITTKITDDCDLLEMWITLMLPKIEHRNNFGVSVKNKILKQIQDVNDTNSFDFINSIYWNTRARLITKVLKYPQISDYRRAINELDEKQHIILNDTVNEIRSYYLSLHDLLLKNLENLKEPCSSNAECFY